MLTFEVVVGGIFQVSAITFPSETVESPKLCLALTRDVIEVAPLTTFCAPFCTAFTKSRLLSSGSLLSLAMKNIPHNMSISSSNGNNGAVYMYG